MSDKPDFEKLKAERDEALKKMIAALCEEHGWDPAEVQASSCDHGCYCACPDGPCEHEFQGWREFDDGNGGEQFCNKCGAGAMSHSMRFDI